MTKQFGNLIAGDWINTDASNENRNPSDLSDVIGAYAVADTAQLDAAVAGARAALPACRAMGIEARQSALEMIGRELMDRAEELGRLLSREEGKPLAEGKGEVYRAGQFDQVAVVLTGGDKAAVEVLEPFGDAFGDVKRLTNVTRDVIAADAHGVGKDHLPFHEDRHAGGARAKVDAGRTKFLFVLDQRREASGVGGD